MILETVYKDVHTLHDVILLLDHRDGGAIHSFGDGFDSFIRRVFIGSNSWPVIRMEAHFGDRHKDRDPPHSFQGAVTKYLNHTYGGTSNTGQNGVSDWVPREDAAQFLFQGHMKMF